MQSYSQRECEPRLPIQNTVMEPHPLASPSALGLPVQSNLLRLIDILKNADEALYTAKLTKNTVSTAIMEE